MAKKKIEEEQDEFEESEDEEDFEEFEEEREKEKKEKVVKKTSPKQQQKFVAFHIPERSGILNTVTQQPIGEDVLSILAIIKTDLEEIKKAVGI